MSGWNMSRSTTNASTSLASMTFFFPISISNLVEPTPTLLLPLALRLDDDGFLELDGDGRAQRIAVGIEHRVLGLQRFDHALEVVDRGAPHDHAVMRAALFFFARRFAYG